MAPGIRMVKDMAKAIVTKMTRPNHWRRSLRTIWPRMIASTPSELEKVSASMKRR